MRTCFLFALALVVLSGCGTDDPAAPAAPADPFALVGAWLYLGPSDKPHNLTVSDGAMAYTDVDGQWSSSFTIKAYDNGSHHFQVAFASGAGTYLPAAESTSGIYDIAGTFLTVQLGKDPASYPQLEGPGTCTRPADGTPVPDCRLYVKMN
jgi:hypothetical protein